MRGLPRRAILWETMIPWNASDSHLSPARHRSAAPALPRWARYSTSILVSAIACLQAGVTVASFFFRH